MRIHKYISSDRLSNLVFPLIVILTILPVIYIIHKVFIGDIPFWYDPARDFLSAWDNLAKPTLIGPTSGIPGVFYGPYWIWLLSLGMFFSKDPRVVDFVALTVPYVLLFPLVLQLYKPFSKKTAFLLFVLFILGFNTYATFLWNPHPAPLILLAYILLLCLYDRYMFRRRWVLAMGAGFFLGLLVNFHMSLGIGTIFGTGIYLITLLLLQMKNKKKYLSHIGTWMGDVACLAFGFLVAFGPYLVFELRHHFQQTKVLLNTLTHYGGTITLHGLTKAQIVSSFFDRAGEVLHLPTSIAVFLFLLTGVYTVFLSRKKRLVLSPDDKKLLGILLSISLGILFIYLTARNPVWSYHFIAVEILFLLLVGLFIEKVPAFRIVMLLWSLLLLVQFAISFPGRLATNPQKISGDLASEEVIVHRIAYDAGDTSYTVYAYSPSIYMYEYSYLFRWLEHKYFSYDPGKIKRQRDVYLIMPPHVKPALYQNFINYRTPPAEYKTLKIWTMQDGSIIIKRREITH